MGRKTICLNMIVKNEAHLIAETLAHLLTYMTFDYWVISDTGSTDATREIIKDFFKSRNIPGELVEHAWQDFGYNRSKAFEAAYNKTDYAFVWDADDEICGAFKMPENLTADSYLFTFGNHDGFRYSRHQLFNNRKRWCYKGVLHEYAACMEQTGPAGSVVGDYFFVSGRRGDRSKDPNKYFKDAQILEKASEKALAEKDPLYNRYIFYCAQSYASCNMHEKAIEFYKKALTIDMWVQEKYVSCLEIYEQYLRLGREIEGLPYLVQSHKYDRERIECIYRLIKYYTINEPIDVAYNYYGLIEDFYENRYDGAKLAEKLFAKKADYDFYLPYYMVITAEKSRHPETAAKMYESILKHGHLADEWWLRNLVFNIQFCFSHLPKTTDFLYKFMNYIAAARKKGVTFEAVHLNVMQRLIDLYKPILSLTDKKVSKPDRKIKVMMTFTTCKRLDLFEQTMNSILNSWTDLDKVDYFFCVDDNSSQRDRTKMQTMCPFMDFYMKRKGEKGHRASMNIIYDKLKELQPTYWIHMEDDWIFFESNSYVQKSIDFLEKHKDKNIHQVLYNRNYAETYEGWDINGSEAIQGEPGFILHVKSDKIPGRNSAYWPHYSFRPSMIRVNTIIELGNYDSPNTFFERDYADRYFAKGYKSAFFNTVSCLHIGKLTSDKTGPNAYSLNNMGQFNELENKLPNAFVVNLVRRTDRKEATENAFEAAGIKDSEYEFVEAVDGKSLTLTDEINTLFVGNDFGSRKGVIGCALSHYGLWKQLAADSTNEYYTIFEDDIQLVDGFKTRWIAATAATAALATSDADIIFLGYHVRDIHNTEKTKVSDKPIVQLDSDKYIGGFFAYIITKKGCKKMLDYISTNGIKHGIDYLVKVVPSFKSYNCQPHIVLSDWVTSLKSTVDTDIQKDYSSLEIIPKHNSDDWTFYEGVDSGGDDIRRVNGPISEMMAAASADSRCVAFNTLGFLKSKTTQPFKATPYISAPGTGIYIKKSYMGLECMNVRVPERESYELKDLVGLARRCDWFVYHNGYINVAKTSSPKTVFISGCYCFLPYSGEQSFQYFMDNLLPLIKSKFNLIIVNNDNTFPSGNGDARGLFYTDKQPAIQSLLNNSLLNRGFVENLDTLHPKLSPIPLGILKNGQRGYHSNLELTNDVIDFSSRMIKCMCIHRNRGGPQWEQRARVTELCKTTWSSFVTYYEGDTMNDDGISEKMKQAQFCICARGGGYDPSPKAWSALINGCIPIIQHSPLDEAYSRLPVILVDDFTPESLSQEKLDGWLNELRGFYEDPVKRLEVLKMLSLDYWWSLINDIGPVIKSKWITSFLCGGTGNRLFQIAAAMAEATKLGRELVFYKPMINNKTLHNISELYEMFPNIRIVDEAAQVYIVKELEMDNYTYKGFTGLDKVDKHIALQGYWQNHQYLPSSGFNPVLKGHNLYSKYGLDTLDAKLNSWFIHLRLGDYKLNGCVNHITMETYYTKVLDKIPTGANVILFSDEPDLAQEQIRNHIPKSMQLRICNENSVSVCLGLMSQCWGGAIVPNSTFSWWGAYLARQASPKPDLFRGYFPKRWASNIPFNLTNNCNPTWAISIDNTIEMTEKEEWIFYEGLDSGGADIRSTNVSDISNMKAVAETQMGCVAFNTLGFLKYSVKFPLEKTPYIRASGGLYVKKSYMSDSIKTNKNTYTIAGRTDGFGGQYQGIMSGIAISEYKKYKYIHTPLVKVEGLLDTNTLNEFIGIPLSADIKMDNNTIQEAFSTEVHYSKRPSLYYTPSVISKIRSWYYSTDKPKITNIDIAIHIRRGDVNSESNSNRYTDNSTYANIIKALKVKYPSYKILIFSQGSIDDFKELGLDDDSFRLNEDVCVTFHSLVSAKILLTARSSLSYSAAILNTNTIYYHDFWHAPLDNWLRLDELRLDNTIAYLAGGMLGDFIHQLSIINENYIKTGKKGILYISSKYHQFRLGLERAYKDTESFIKLQPYIHQYKIHNGEAYDINLSSWRNNPLIFKTSWYNLFKAEYGVEWGTHPWLYTSVKKSEFSNIVLFNSVMTRFPEKINYTTLFNEYGKENIRFITENVNEYVEFKNKTGIELEVYIPTSIDDFINTVNSCKLFIGTQSSPLTYAYGLHKNSITLINHEHPDAIFVNHLEHILPGVKILTDKKIERNTISEEWTFYEGVDSGGADIGRSTEQNIESLKATAEANPNCVAFNTLGFLKSYVKFPLEKTPYINAPGGLYIKKSYKPTIRVKMLCNWCSSEDLCKEWLKMSKGSYKWNDIEITWSDDNIDYYVIINKPQDGAKYVPEKTIIFHMEPWCDSPHQNWGIKTWGEWAKPDPTKFLQVRTHDKFLNPGFWQLSLTYSQLKEMDMLKSADKSKIVSSICSSKYFDPGHKKRIDFLKFVEAKGSVKLHIYNEDNQHEFKSYQGTATPSIDKDKGLVPYKYYFMCENNAEANFITEKLWEPILCEALCFYWGCPNVADHVDPMAYVQLNMDDFEASYNMMNAAIETNLWQERLPYIKKAKQRILDEQGFFPMLENALKPKAACFIHSCHLASAGTGTLDLVLSAAIGIKELNAIIVNNIGLPLDSKKYTALDSRIQIIQCSSDPELFELPTLRLMHEFSLNSPNTKILYLHTKGISYVGLLGYEVILDWINYMLYFLCTKSKDCLKLLDTHDAAGCNFSEAPKPHFSGNFWWATTKYLKKLDTALLTDKMSAEWWLHSGKPKRDVLWNSGKNHFKERYPIELYFTKFESLDTCLSSITKDKNGIEIGGPSRHIAGTIYKNAKLMDNVIFSSDTVWSKHLSREYKYYDKKVGNVFINDAVNISDVSNNSYDFVFSSHSLEHIANPIKALKEWLRILRNDGYIILILPDKNTCFDHKREYSKISTLISQYEKNVGEDDLSTLPEILEKHDLSKDPPAGNLEQFKKRSLDNYNNRCLHHYVYNEQLLNEITTYLKCKFIYTKNENGNIWYVMKKQANNYLNTI